MANQVSDLRLFFYSSETRDGLLSFEFDEDVKKFKEQVGKVRDISWDSVSGEISEKVEDVLKVDIADILCAAWKKYRLLTQFCNKEAYGPDETILVPLAEHRVESLHRPSIDLLINDLLLGRLVFEIRLSLRLEGVVLKVRDGRIREVKTGSCSGEGRMKCRDITLISKQTPRFDLPGRIDLGEGVEIPAH